MNISANINIGFGVSATLSAEQSRTGRGIVADQLFGHVQVWAADPESDARGLEDNFLALLSGWPVLPPGYRKCFRGRHDLETGNPTPLNFGPPPAKIASVNRYNAEGEAVLYLSGSLNGVGREFEDSGSIWAQEYLLPEGLRIADFRVERRDDLMSKVFWITENAERGVAGYPYDFGQYISHLVSGYFDGMAVPGVRGDSTEHYFNIVVLNKVQEWQDWVSIEKNPTRIR